MSIPLLIRGRKMPHLALLIKSYSDVESAHRISSSRHYLASALNINGKSCQHHTNQIPGLPTALSAKNLYHNVKLIFKDEFRMFLEHECI